MIARRTDWGRVPGRAAFFIACGLVLLFLILPILVVVPLSFNAQPYLTFSSDMLALRPEGFSLRWYEELLSSPRWGRSIVNSVGIGVAATLISTVLGTAAAFGLTDPRMPARSALTALIVSPLVVPMIITAAGTYFFYSSVGLVDTYGGIILAHVVVGTPFVVITVTASLASFDRTLYRAALTLGAAPLQAFLKIVLPIILPGVLSGALFAFLASFDEIAIVLFIAPNPDHYTIPREMWSGLREQISPAILAMATVLIVFSTLVLVATNLLRDWSDRNLRAREE
ncbi:ABC transporter permease [Mesorhizobium sp. M0751]|uniref:ABC transporter permease n=1 Tax=unclassified Mesorhizobium TaxID=325217 RepID=UPI00333B0C38